MLLEGVAPKGLKRPAAAVQSVHLGDLRVLAAQVTPLEAVGVDPGIGSTALYIIPASIVLDGEYGEHDVAMGVPVKINQSGVIEIQQIRLDDTESSSLKKSSEKIRNDIKSINDD